MSVQHAVLANPSRHGNALTMNRVLTRNMEFVQRAAIKLICGLIKQSPKLFVS
jgi:hypothetical protein